MGDKKYKAFISYSHADEAWGGWLQRALERFRAPGALARRLEAEGGAARLAPVFRDREDLPVAGNLNAAIQAALADSEYQIVLCSPNAAKSKWVNEEIKLFHKLHGPGKVFALIIDGEPFASGIDGRAEEECFPPALRVQLGADGEETEAPAEPLAADAREHGDGRRYAMLKVAAGMLGVGLDDLVRRDAQRRARQAWTITGASLAGTAAAAALAFYAVAKGNEATRMRGEAETLIEFMLTDLKDRLEPVGRLDVLEAVVAKAMNYYENQDARALDDDALARRAKAMMQLGTIDYRRNNFNDAQKAYESAEAASGELLRRAPNNPDRIFDHAQNVFYVGETAARRYDQKKREQQNNEYLRLAQRLVELEPENPRSRLEVAYATSNIGGAYFTEGEYAKAIPYFERSIEARAELLAADPENDGLRRAYAYAISWLAYSLTQLGDYQAAIEQLQKQLKAYGRLAETKTQDFSALDAVVTAQRRLAIAYLLLGDRDAASEVNEAARVTANALVARDPLNANWGINAAHIERERSILLFGSGDLAGAETAANRSVQLIEAVLTEDASQWYYSALGQSLAWRIELLGGQASVPDAGRLDKLIASAIDRDAIDNASFIASASLALARCECRRGANQSASDILGRAITALEPVIDRMPAPAKIDLAAIFVEAGEPKKAAPLIAELDALGTRRSDFLALKEDYLKIAAQ
ncbi:MAG: toll/interleukin-1 receptor domain-containing protein [Parvularculaceae bacterium]|nr:toll/interleukin-1 receptor domain-containing protein [Parvularculaceae bacterium]